MRTQVPPNSALTCALPERLGSGPERKRPPIRRVVEEGGAAASEESDAEDPAVDAAVAAGDLEPEAPVADSLELSAIASH